MREAAFVKQNIHRWQKHERLLNDQAGLTPEKKSELFIELTDDLSFAQTQYPDSETARYLNHLTSKIHQQVYKNKKEDRSRFLTFWTRELPALFLEVRREMLVSFIITAVAAAIGAVSTLGDKTFARLILGDGYVNTTLVNIKAGHPTGIYDSMDPFLMFFRIIFNNIVVSFRVFAAGLIFSVGSGWMLFYNGIMLGTFFALFYQHNLFLYAAPVVMLHGTVEIFSLIMAGAAGIRMGNGFLFPGTYLRIDSFKRGAKDGLKLVMGLIPFFMVAGTIESFVTRYADMPAALKILIIGVSGIFITFYFFVYPTRFRSHVPKD